MLAALVLIGLQTVATDPRLDKPIGIAEYAVSAPQVCSYLSRLTGVGLTCDPFLADDLIVLSVKRRPASETMAKVAGHFGWRWVARDGGYRLEPTDAFLSRAKNGRREILLAEGRRRQQAARDLIAEIKSQDRDAIAAKREKAEEAEQEAEARSDIRSGDDRMELQARRVQLEQRLNPQTPVALSALAEISPEQMADLYDDRMFLTGDPGPLGRDIGEATSQSIGRCLAEIAKEEADAAKDDADGPGIPSGPLPTRISIQLDSWDVAHVVALGDKGQVLRSSDVSFPAPPAPLMPLPKEMEAAMTRKAHLKPGDGPNWIPGEEPLDYFGKWFAWVGGSLNCDVISDAYDAYFLPNDNVPVDRRQLDKLRGQGFRPVCGDGWLSNRNSEWPRYREESFPRRIMHGLEPIEFVSLDWRAELASEVTRANMKSKLSDIQPYQYPFYLFWGSLTTATKDALLSGRKLRLSQLPASVVAYLYEAGESPIKNGVDMRGLSFGLSPFDEPEFADFDARLAVVSREYDENSERPIEQFSDFAALYPARVDPSSEVWLDRADIPGLYDMKDFYFMCPSMLVRAVLGKGPFKLGHCQAFRVHVGFRPGVEVQAFDTEVALGEDLTGDSTKWPKDLLDRIRRDREFLEKLEKI